MRGGIIRAEKSTESLGPAAETHPTSWVGGGFFSDEILLFDSVDFLGGFSAVKKFQGWKKFCPNKKT